MALHNPENPTALTAHVLACIAIIGQAVRNQRDRADAEGLGRIVAHTADGGNIASAPYPEPQQHTRRRLAALANTAAVHEVWRRHSGSVIAVDPHSAAQAWEALTPDRHADTTAFARLPFPSPLIAFTDPLPFVTLDGVSAQLLGFHMVGLSADRTRMCSTDDPAIGMLSATAVVHMPESEEFQFTRFRIPLAADLELEQHVDAVIDGFKIDGVKLAASADHDTVRAALRIMVGMAFGALSYICAAVPQPDADDGAAGQR